MATTTALEFLQSLHIDEMVADMQDKRVADKRLVWLNRLNRVPMDNRQLLARHQKRVHIAPMISTNAKTPVFRAQKFTAQSANLGKIKIATQWNEEEMEEWLDLINSNIRDPDNVLARGMVEDAIADHLDGIDRRLNWLAIAMQLDGKVGSADYSDFGFMLEDVDWGRFGDLKQTVTPWTDHVNADPIADIWAARDRVETIHGWSVNRATMPQVAFRHAIQCQKYKDRVPTYLPPTTAYAQIPGVMTPFQINLFEQIAGVTVEFDDTRFEWQDDADAWHSTRYHPLTPTTPVVLDNSADDRNNAVHFMGVGTPMEGRMREIVGGRDLGGQIGGPDRPANRVVSYAYMPTDMDPVNLTVFSALKAFPQSRNRASNVTLYVGNMAETYDIQDFFPE